MSPRTIYMNTRGETGSVALSALSPSSYLKEVFTERNALGELRKEKRVLCQLTEQARPSQRLTIYSGISYRMRSIMKSKTKATVTISGYGGLLRLLKNSMNFLYSIYEYTFGQVLRLSR